MRRGTLGASCPAPGGGSGHPCPPAATAGGERLSYPAAMSEGLLFLKPLHLDRAGTCTDWDVREGKPSDGG